MESDRLVEELREANGANQTIRCVILSERLIEGGAKTYWIYSLYAKHLISIGRFDQARKAIREAAKVASASRRPWIIHRSAILEKTRGNFEAALENWKTAHALDRDEATFLIYAASMAFRLGDVEEAVRLSRQGTTCSKGFPDEAWYNLGGYLASQERYDEALFCYEKARKIDPDYKIAQQRIDEIRQCFSEG